MNRLNLSLLFCVFFSQLYAQMPFSQHIPVEDNQGVLPLAWTGGFSNPQFSNIDLDLDGIKDLVVFDRSDDHIIPFLARNGTWKFAPQYAASFPAQLKNWVLLKDFNCDGYEDIFTGIGSSNIRVYKNTSAQMGYLSFKIAVDTVKTLYYGQSTSFFLFSTGIDIPGIADVDGDNDIDFLTYDATGSFIELHRNIASTCDSIVLKQGSDCFGHFSESYNFPTNTYDLVLNNTACSDFPRTMHSGGAVLPLSLDGDTLIDLLISDNGPTSVIAALNGGNKLFAHIVTKIPNYPTAHPVNITTFPACFNADTDFDGLKDLVVAPNSLNTPMVECQDWEGFWQYKNTGTALTPNFQYVRNDFLANQMIEGGSHSQPVFFDQNGDGNMDLWVIYGKRWNGTAVKYAASHLYRNIGTNASPRFKLMDSNYLNIRNNGITDTLRYLVPALADLDADGDQDLVLGTEKNNLIYFRNDQASPSDSAKFVFVTNNYQNISMMNPSNPTQSLLLNASPCLADVDNDSDYDLFIGRINGEIAFYENKGSAQNAFFQLQDSSYGNINVTDQTVAVNGYARPQMIDMDKNGSKELVVGSLSGYIHMFGDIDVTGSQLIQYGTVGNHDFGRNVCSAGYYFHPDTLTWLIGSERGGLRMMTFPTTLVNREENAISQAHLQIFPNPGTDFVEISVDKKITDPQVMILDVHGREILSSKQLKINTSELPNGLYIIQVRSQEMQLQSKWIKIK